MNTETQPNAGRGWLNSPLYMFLLDHMPEYRSKRGGLDVPRFCRELDRSTEGFYKVLRSSRLMPAVAKALCDLANSPENTAALRKAKRKPPTIRDFDTFVYSA